MHKLIIFIAAFFLLPLSTAHAESDVTKEWDKKSKTLENIYANNFDGCNKVFTLLWNDAKKGDLDARFTLLVQMTVMHGHYMQLPGGSDDSLTLQRHNIILAAHSIGSKFDIEDARADSRPTHIDSILTSVNKPNSKFSICMQESRSNECVRILEKNFLPPFDVFADEIDVFIKAGYKAKCAAQ